MGASTNGEAGITSSQDLTVLSQISNEWIVQALFSVSSTLRLALPAE